MTCPIIDFAAGDRLMITQLWPDGDVLTPECPQEDQTMQDIIEYALSDEYWIDVHRVNVLKGACESILESVVEAFLESVHCHYNEDGIPEETDHPGFNESKAFKGAIAGAREEALNDALYGTAEAQANGYYYQTR